MLQLPKEPVEPSLEENTSEDEILLDRWSVEAFRVPSLSPDIRENHTDKRSAEQAYARIGEEYPHHLVVLEGAGEINVAGSTQPVSVALARPGNAELLGVDVMRDLEDAVPDHHMVDIKDTEVLFSHAKKDARILIRLGSLRSNPRDDTTICRLVTSRSYGDAHLSDLNVTNREDMQEYMNRCRETGGFAYALWAHEHDSLTLGVTHSLDESPPLWDSWDTSLLGFVLVTPEHLEETGVQPDAEKVLQQVRGELDEYQIYLNGEGYTICHERCVAADTAYGGVAWVREMDSDAATLEEAVIFAAMLGGFDSANPINSGWCRVDLATH